MREIKNALYPIDIKESRRIQSENSNLIKAKECYNNVWNIFSNTTLFMQNNQYMIAYGYVIGKPLDIYIRHCFIFDTITNKIIDPTLANREYAETLKYKIIQIYSQDEYLDALSKYRYTDLHNDISAKQLFASFQQESLTHGVACLG